MATGYTGAPGSLMRWLGEHPEPGPRQVDLNPHARTPWGMAQSAERLGPGLVQYSTAGHGGFHVSAALLKRIPDYLQTADAYADGRAGWYEEDCAWAIVAVCLPEFFPLETRLDAVAVLRNTYPAEFERYCRAGEAESRSSLGVEQAV